VRKLTERSYELEITALYENDSSVGKEDTQVLRGSFELEAIKQLVHSSITTSFSEVEFTDRNGLFVLGFDSLKTVAIAGMLKAELLNYRKKSELSWLSDRLLYSNPTVDQLSAAIYNFLNLGVMPGVNDNNRSHIRRAKMATLVEKFTQNLLQRSPQPYSQSRAAGIVIALTGSTGSLGSYLLQALLNDLVISKIYSLTRSADAHQRHENMFAKHGPTTRTNN